MIRRRVILTLACLAVLILMLISISIVPFHYTAGKLGAGQGIPAVEVLFRRGKLIWITRAPLPAGTEVQKHTWISKSDSFFHKWRITETNMLLQLDPWTGRYELHSDDCGWDNNVQSTSQIGISSGLHCTKLVISSRGPLLFCALLSAYPFMVIVRAARHRALAFGRRHRGLCIHCGYNLTSNVSGVCPECGTRL